MKPTINSLFVSRIERDRQDRVESALRSERPDLVEAPAFLDARIMARIDSTPLSHAASPRWTPRLLGAAALAAVVLVAGLGALVIMWPSEQVQIQVAVVPETSPGESVVRAVGDIRFKPATSVMEMFSANPIASSAGSLVPSGREITEAVLSRVPYITMRDRQ